MSYNIIVFGQKNTWSWWGWRWFCSLWWWSMCSWWMLRWKALQNLIHIKFLESPEAQAKQKSRKCTNAWPKNGESAIFFLVDCNTTVILWCLNDNATPYSPYISTVRHPDKNKNPEAEDMFIKITKSYEVLQLIWTLKRLHAVRSNANVNLILLHRS